MPAPELMALIEQLDDEISMIEVDPAEWAAQQIKDRKRMRAKLFWLAQQQCEEENEHKLS